MLGQMSNWSICTDSTIKQAAPIDQLAAYFEQRYQDPWGSPASPHDQLANLHYLEQLTEGYQAWAALKRGVSKGEVKKVKLQDAVTQGVGFAEGETSDLSSLFIPSLVSTANIQNPRYVRALRNSRVLELFQYLAGKLIIPPQPEKQNSALPRQEKDIPRFQSFYFISVDGALRYSPASRLNVPAHRLFHYASYVAGALGKYKGTEGISCPSNRSRYLSHPYLDLLGEGVVSTVCYPIMYKEQIVDGVFCIDIGVPRSVLYENILSKLSNMLQIEVALVKEDSGNPGVDNAEIHPCGDSEENECPPGVEVVSEDQGKRKMVARVREWLANTSEGMQGPSSVEIAPGNSGNEKIFLAVLAAWPEEGKRVREIGLFRIKPSSGENKVFAAASAAVVLTLLGAGLMARARVQHLRRRESSLARGLPIAVARVSSGGDIEGANDQAERLLGRRLPRLGVVPHGSLMDAFNLDEYLSGCRLAKKFSGKFKEVGYPEIRTDRKRGLTSEYWAELVVGSDKRWVRIVGAPIVTPSGARDTFGILERATEADEEALRTLARRDNQ
jgi:PAS domain-containing protein